MSKEVSGMMIDAYEAGSKAKTLSNPLLNTQKVYDYSSTYGVVLAGESVRLHQCSKEYIKSNKMKITHHIAQFIEKIEVTTVNMNVCGRGRGRGGVGLGGATWRVCY